MLVLDCFVKGGFILLIDLDILAMDSLEEHKRMGLCAQPAVLEVFAARVRLIPLVAVKFLVNVQCLPEMRV